MSPVFNSVFLSTCYRALTCLFIVTGVGGIHCMGVWEFFADSNCRSVCVSVPAAKDGKEKLMLSKTCLQMQK